MRRLLVLASLLCPLSLQAQWQMQVSSTTADLRSVHAASHDVAWASGSNGTVLRTTDAGSSWTSCAVPPGADRADLVGVQAVDSTTAVVITSGKGRPSRVYRTTDACQTWKLVFDNPDPTGLFANLRRVTSHQLYLLGAPVAGKFSLFLSQDAGATWFIADDPGLDAKPGDTATPASNSSLIAVGPFLFFGTGGGTTSPSVYFTVPKCDPATPSACTVAWDTSAVPAPAGAFISSLAAHSVTSMGGKTTSTLLALLNLAAQPDASMLAISADDGRHWSLATTPMHGYGSAIASDAAHALWIAVGSAGTTLSHDNGATWHPFATSSAAPAQPWSALSLPFAVGPHGAIGKLNEASFKN